MLDLVVSVLFALFLIGEYTADEEMWKFQEDKRRRLENSEDMSSRSPFYREGMYRYTRHPNYFCEVFLYHYTLPLIIIKRRVFQFLNKR